MREKEILLIIPAYNEEPNIERTLEGLLKDPVSEELDILLINDGSTDGTREKAQRFMPKIKIIDQIFHMGYGAALQTGYKFAVKHGYSFLLQMDSDGQHDPASIKPMIARLKGETGPAGIPPNKKAKVKDGQLPDIVIGSRFLEESRSFRISGLKKLAISFFTGTIRAMTGYHLTDPTSGLQGMNRKAFGYYSGFSNFDIHYPDLNMIVQMLFLGYHVEEIPAVMHERTAGKSMHGGPWHSIRYMFVMVIGTFNSFTRHYRFGRKERTNEGQ